MVAETLNVREASRASTRFDVPPRMRADVRLLGETLGAVIREQAGESVYADVERLRELTIAAYADDASASENAAERVDELDALSYLGLRALRTLRSSADLPTSGPGLPERLLQLSVSGVAAGLQSTG